ncbi:hypothetical protein LTR37_015865 [Vermiconidia calcicola]|uniref:Uncharacterized protein n=1 Tax=Vermiconidia calcicola TaxID=1690605 RepID=A0ACC3MR64_9PEZI|nr:hypothetical protein LTR37_015865 [Vermiconidia calcicola]
MATNEASESKHLDAAETVLNDVTDKSKIESDYKDHIHIPGNSEKAHTWFRAIFPYDSLEEFEAQWHLGNYVIDRRTGQKSFEPMSIYVRVGMHLLYYGSAQENLLQCKRVQSLLKNQSINMGKQYDSPQSKDHILPFIESFDLQSSLDDLLQPDPTKYSSFNEFFARQIKESARPIAEPNSDKAVSSMADCRLTTYPTTDLATKYWIKGFGFTLAKLLDSDKLAECFKGGPILIHRLAPQDYHRWHAPVSGTIRSITEIPGTQDFDKTMLACLVLTVSIRYYTVNPQAINEEGTLDGFCENRRSVMIVQRPSGSTVALIAIGAMLVGSIKYNPEIKEGVGIRRGQCLGAFYYGGSTIISLHGENEMKLDDDLVKNSTQQKCETYVKVGWRVGQWLPGETTRASKV